MAYLEIDLAKIQYNALMLKYKLEQRGLDITPVIKCIAGDRPIVEALKALGIHHVGDARFANIDKLHDDDLSYMMIRTPNRRELKDTVLKTSISIQTDLETIHELNQVAASLGRKHKILLMVDWKDSREGVLTYDVVEYINEILHMKHICLAGLAFNFMCFQDIPPTEEDILLINQFIQSVEKKTGYPLKMISGGNSSALPLLDFCTFGRINDLRIGESLFRGTNTVDQQPIHYLFQDAITLKAEIIEIKPRIDTVQDASYLQAILDVGQIDTAVKDIFPLYDNVRIMGATSDHLMVDLKNSDYHSVGDIMTFKLGYQALAQSMYQQTLPHEYVREPGIQILVDTFQTADEKVKIK
ncbi:amino acid racemase [Staphylococcus piscifermentans]|uniref:Alanine racemase n=1 Tax=Staphylococcus piscifermentans TaxID=70258 RepID=A0A239TRB1_9STAP|nr:alanine racemase [Staphylococcus piscifermentans]RTX85559.1 alanine racemase [Staphylococcus piscifermentans]GEP85765.1 alanine racemase [Staphylococcus piscifermentans]SNV00531.1 amino acid racemase [Staphylococcus piscifermentans]